MIGFIKGIIAYKGLNNVIVETNGVGFELSVSAFTVSALPDAGQSATILTYMHVREDEITLYGFSDMQEKEVFKKLIEVNGVGPKMAINILSGINANNLAMAIATQNQAVLKGIKGVGTKLRERILLELKEKMNFVGDIPIALVSTSASAIFDPAVAVLVDWGVNKNVATSIIQDKIEAGDTLETLLAKAFKELGR